MLKKDSDQCLVSELEESNIAAKHSNRAPGHR